MNQKRKITTEESTNKPSSNGHGNGNNNNKNNGKPNIGITGVRWDYYVKHDAKVPGMDKNNVIFGFSGQVDRYLKASKGLIEWVGTSMENNNVVYSYLTDKVEPTFPEPMDPDKDGTIA